MGRIKKSSGRRGPVRFVALVLVAGHALSCFAGERYIVKKGDNIGKILYSRGIKPLWGRSGTVRECLALNSESVDSDARIFPGQVLRLPSIRSGVNLSSASNLVTGENVSRAPAAETAQKVNIIETQPRSEAKPIAGSESLNLAETSETAVPTPSEREQQTISEIYGRGQTNFSQISGVEKSNGSRGTVVSDVNYVGTIGYLQDWGTWKTSYEFTAGKSAYQQDSARSFVKNKISLYGFNVAARVNSGARFSWFGELGVKQEAFYYAASTTQMGLSKASIPFYGAGFEARLFQNKNTRVCTGLILNHLLPANTGSTHVKNGYGARVFVGTDQSWRSVSISPNLFYEFQKQDSDVLKRSQLRFGLSLEFKKRLDYEK